jgi:hypothetical protein
MGTETMAIPLMEMDAAPVARLKLDGHAVLVLPHPRVFAQRYEEMDLLYKAVQIIVMMEI